jgi:uncharacterized protein YodC (DUF2158 family)
MTIEAGTVVMLKSGGEPMTVVAVDGETAECIWCGEEGDLFRESIPTLALQIAMPVDEDEADESDDDGEDEAADEDESETAETEETEETAPEPSKTSRKRTAA